MEFYEEIILKKYITGILYLDSKIKYGNQKDKQIYLFRPTNKKYPEFYIPYKTDIRMKLYVNIKFKELRNDDKYFGTIIDIIGNLGDKDAEFEHLRNYYEIKNNTWKIDNKKIKADLEKLNTIDSKKEDYRVFSIDPEGSKDIDDAFHYIRYPPQGGYEIGIHIANPVVFFKDSYQTVLDRVSTVYLPTSNRKYNMLPSIYADDMVSLLENKKRFALSLIIKLNDKFEIPHVDLLDGDELPKLKLITGLYYINDSDGDTILYNEKYSKDLQHPLSICKIITPKKGRMVFFSGDRMHSAGYPSLSKKRLVANFNFSVDFY